MIQDNYFYTKRHSQKRSISKVKELKVFQQKVLAQ